MFGWTGPNAGRCMRQNCDYIGARCERYMCPDHCTELHVTGTGERLHPLPEKGLPPVPVPHATTQHATAKPIYRPNPPKKVATQILKEAAA